MNPARRLWATSIPYRWLTWKRAWPIRRGSTSCPPRAGMTRPSGRASVCAPPPMQGSRKMLRILLATALALTAPCAAQADITVFTSGGTNPGLQTLSAAWTAKTGKKVTVVGGTVTRAHDNVKNKVPGDLVVLPLPDLTDVSANLKPGRFTPVGRAN